MDDDQASGWRVGRRSGERRELGLDEPPGGLRLQGQA